MMIVEYWKDQDEPFLEDERDEDEAMKRREVLMTIVGRNLTLIDRIELTFGRKRLSA